MNIFVLSTGRCGSATFVKACSHITNYTSAHESRASKLGPSRIDYPDNHIESDNRLCWFLGRLDEKYGNDAFYVHLARDRVETAKSYSKRFGSGLIMNAYAKGIYLRLPDNVEKLSIEIASDYIYTIESNIKLFLANKKNKMNMSVHKMDEEFQLFWDRIGAKGDLSKALKECGYTYNTLETEDRNQPPKDAMSIRLSRKLYRIATKFPAFIRDA